MTTEFWETQSLFKTLYSNCVESVCEKHHLTRMELDILLFLANNPQFDTAANIVEIRHLTKSHVSTSIRALESRGLLTKSYAPGNHKTIHLAPTPAAGDMIAEGKACQERFLKIIFRNFSEEELATLKQSFSQIADNIRTHMKEEHHAV